MTTYRWNTEEATRGYDQAADVIHPHYGDVQQTIIRHLKLRTQPPGTIVDLGGGSGRLMELLLDEFPEAHGFIVDQSQEFLGLAAERLAAAGDRITFFHSSLQSPDWSEQLPEAVDVIVSSSAIHHLEPHEKRGLYSTCQALLTRGGVFLNGDEFRPENDDHYLELLLEWSEHMHSALDDAQIPASFQETIAAWRERNIDRFDSPRASGDDCHETIEAQTEYLLGVGFGRVRTIWQRKLWAVLVAE